MADTILRDKSNRIIGYIRTSYTGVQTLTDSHNIRRGTYDPAKNETRDKNNQLVGKGNLLLTLL